MKLATRCAARFGTPPKSTIGVKATQIACPRNLLVPAGLVSPPFFYSLLRLSRGWLQTDLVFVKRAAQANAGKHGLGLLGWEADLRAEPPDAGA